MSPDGAHIAFSPQQPFGDFRAIWISDVEQDNPPKVLGVSDAEWLRSVRWSPDGRRLAYIRAQRRLDKYFQWIESCDLKGENRTSLLAVEGRGPWVKDIAWLKDGRVVYSRMESVPSEDANLWQIAVDVKSGAPTSGSKRITNWAGSNLFGLTASADGTRIALRKDTLRSQIWLGELISRGHLKDLPRRLTDDEASDFVSDWTSDGKAVIYESYISAKPKIFKQSISSEEPEPLVVGPEAVDWARLSPDGAWVLYTEIRAASTNGGTPVFRLMRVPANGGSPRLVLESQNPSFGSGLFNCGRAPASVCLVREKSADHKILRLVAFDPYTGKQKPIRSIPMPADVGLQGMMSPDGSIYAAVRMSQVDTRIHLFSLSGGPDREVTVKGWPNIVSLDWSPDGKGFYCGSASPESSTLLFVDLQGTSNVVWRDRETNGAGCFGIPSPDNRHLAIMSWVHNSNVWTIENF